MALVYATATAASATERGDGDGGRRGSRGMLEFRAKEVPTRIGQDACVRVKAQLGLNGEDAPTDVKLA